MKGKEIIYFFKSLEFLITAAVVVIISAAYLLGLFDRFELTSVDNRFRLRGRIETRPEVVFIDMAEDSIKNIGRWPWPREWHTTLVSVLSEYKPRAIAFDVLFIEPSTKDMDDGLAEAIKEEGSVYLPFLIDYEKERVKEIVFPIKGLKESARGLGFLDIIPDQDGIVRRVPLVIKFGEKYYPHLSFKIICDYLDAKDENIVVTPGKDILLKGTRKGDIRIPVDDRCRMIINWAGSWGETFSHYSFYEAILSYKQLSENKKPVIDLNAFRGRICFIGLTAIGLMDTKPIPYDTLYPMVGVHGNIINTVLNKAFIREPGKVTDILCILVLSLFAGYVVYIVRPLLGGIMSLGIVAAYLSLGFFLFVKNGLLIEIVAPSSGVVFTYLAVVLYKYVTEEKKRKWIKNVFSHYISPNLIEQILNNPDQLKLGGVRRELTVLFSDVRGFTTFSENHTPEEVVSILNEFLDAMTKVILKNNGTLDKYVGDEIMAVFGAPLWVPPKEQAVSAVKTALEMVARLKELHEKWAKEGKAPLGMGVGINTGEMISGNMGSTDVFDYTVIGDNVNIGARVEGLTRNYKTDIIITEATHEYVKDDFICKELDSIVVKGKTKPVKIYSVEGFKKQGG